ncbi:hypothetical protein ACLOJK_028442 [Asimina triloba]
MIQINGNNLLFSYKNDKSEYSLRLKCGDEKSTLLYVSVGFRTKTRSRACQHSFPFPFSFSFSFSSYAAVEACSAEKPQKPVVEASFLQTAVDICLLRRKVTRHLCCQRSSLPQIALSLRYLSDMDLGVLEGMMGIQQRARQKLARQQVAAVVQMVNVCRSMRCFLKGSSSSPIVQFSGEPDDSNDTGDGGGIPRSLVLVLLAITCNEDSRMQVNGLSWEEELYPGEFDDLSMSDLLYSKKHRQPVPPRINGWESGNPTLERAAHLPDRDILQVRPQSSCSKKEFYDSTLRKAQYTRVFRFQK